jgi:hypothetical protein
LATLPRLDIAGAVALAQSLEGAALAKKKSTGKATKLPPHIAGNLDAMRALRLAAQTEMGRTAGTSADIRGADREEDLAVRALHGVIAAWALLAGRIPEGSVAEELIAALFADGVGFINTPVLKEWAVVEAKLATIDAEVVAKLTTLGGVPLLDHLRKVHVVYGDTIGATKPVAVAAGPKVGKARSALIAAIRQYVTAVAGNVVTGASKSAALSKRLLSPLTKKAKSPEKAKSGKGTKKGAAAPKATSPAKPATPTTPTA